jgi:hypothetical protein
MKNKGILFVLMGLILALLLLGFAFKINSAYLEAEKKSFSSNALDQIKNKYSNIYSAKDFYREGTTKTYYERIIPFTYSIDGNKISFTQQLPLKQALFKNFFDFVNAYKIFNESSNPIILSGIDIEIETTKNIEWGGSDSNIVFLVKPQCKKYSITDYNSMHFYGSNECADSFNINLIERIDINISVLGSSEDYNFLSCDFGGDLTCYQEAYNEADLLPFIEINLLDENCSNCDLNSDTRKISKHFNSSADNTIIFSCLGAECSSQQIRIFFNENNTEIRHSGTAIQAKTEFLFTQDVNEFELYDLNLTLTDNRFNITKTNK